MMNHPGTAVAGVDPHIEQAGAGCFLAVQQDTTVTCVDWEVFHGWTLDDPDFAGMITVQDGDGAQVGRADWTVPTDAAADRCLAGLGWRRVGAWSWDWSHRRVAQVNASPIIPSQQLGRMSVDRDRWRQPGAARHKRRVGIVYARSTTVLAKRESIDAGIARIRDVALPALQRMDGFIGLSLLVNRAARRGILTSSWESKAAMRAPAGPVGVIRDRAVETLGGTMRVGEWEIPFMHRDHPSHPGACARGTWLRMDPAAIDRAVDVYQTVSIPAMEELDGFCSASLLVERASGSAMSTATYDSREAMQRNREQTDAVLSAGCQETGAKVREVREFELALAHLRVPEIA